MSNSVYYLVTFGFNSANKIEAICFVRALTGWGLVESKQFVDTYESIFNRMIVNSPKLTAVIPENRLLPLMRTIMGRNFSNSIDDFSIEETTAPKNYNIVVR